MFYKNVYYMYYVSIQHWLSYHVNAHPPTRNCGTAAWTTERLLLLVETNVVRW